MKQWLLGFTFLGYFFFTQQSMAMQLHGEKALSLPLYKPSKTGVMKTLDKMNIKYVVDNEGDLVYTMNKKGWTGYVIFSMAGKNKNLWSLQMRTQFATKASYYDDLLEFTNNWNATHKMPKIAMRNRGKMVLSFNYPVQYGFNPKEFKFNVFNLFNRTAEEIGAEINSMRR
ncbi:YbjN domain-containing protein [Thiomicrorhabdus sp.]|uniref:YbjN domain-containing protein n=1 Tax=Thiomicrorhabdus sp. TaxID=2039724 RepID=UPI002AA7E8E6|nr:YbjN domain-containing protein [Thiomicrorhabdus sp.]